jgi:hypothetical protein
MRRTQRQIEGKQAAVYVGLDLTRSPNLDELPSPPMIADEDTIAQNKGTALKGGRTQHRTLANAKTSRRSEGRARADSPSDAAATTLTAESRAKFGRVRLRAGPIRPGRASGDAAGQALSSETKCTLRNFGWNVPGRLRDGRWLEESQARGPLALLETVSVVDSAGSPAAAQRCCRGRRRARPQPRPSAAKPSDRTVAQAERRY